MSSSADNVIDVIARQIQAGMPGSVVAVQGSGGRFEVTVKGVQFAGLSRVRRQQLVYAQIGDLIKSGAVHAVTIRALTLDEGE